MKRSYHAITIVHLTKKSGPTSTNALGLAQSFKPNRADAASPLIRTIFTIAFSTRSEYVQF